LRTPGERFLDRPLALNPSAQSAVPPTPAGGAPTGAPSGRPSASGGRGAARRGVRRRPVTLRAAGTPGRPSACRPRAGRRPRGPARRARRPSAPGRTTPGPRRAPGARGPTVRRGTPAR